MKRIGLTILAIAILFIRPDGEDARTLLENYGFRAWFWVGLGLTAWIAWMIFWEWINNDTSDNER